MTQEEITKEKRQLAVFGLILLLILAGSYFNKASAQDLSQGRIFTRATMPTGTISNFIANRDILIVNGQQYYYSGGWKPVTIIRGEKGDKGDTGATGATGEKGADGVCPDCPPSSGGGTGNVGGVRWVTTWSELSTAIATSTVRSIHLAADITQGAKWRIPATYNRIFEIEGHGFKFIIPSSIDTGIVRAYASLSDANSGIDMQMRIRNVEFVGANNVGISVSAMYGAKIEGCRFSNFKTAIYCGWNMGTIIDQCFFWENNISIELDYARFSGGSNSASQSNHTIVQNCKFRHSAGQFGAIKATAVSGLRITGCIFEGIQNGGQYEVYFDDNGSTVVKDFVMSSCHIEQKPSVAGVYCRLKDGYAYVSHIFSQYDCNLISFESAGYAKMIVEAIPYLTSGTKFTNVNGAGRWEFINPPATFLTTDATRWNGSAPTYLTVTGWDTNGQKKYIQGVTVK